MDDDTEQIVTALQGLGGRLERLEDRLDSIDAHLSSIDTNTGYSDTSDVERVLEKVLSQLETSNRYLKRMAS